MDGQTRIVDGTLLDRSNNAPLVACPVRFLHDGISLSNTKVYPSGITRVRTDSNGYFRVALAVPDGVSERYIVMIGANDTYTVVVKSGAGKININKLLEKV
jgi:hypothetical protein